MVGRAPKRPSLTYRCSETKAEAEGELFYQPFPSFFLPRLSLSPPGVPSYSEHRTSAFPYHDLHGAFTSRASQNLQPQPLNPPRSRASSVKLISQYRLAFGYSLYDAQLQEITPELICSDACALLALNYLILVFI